VRALDLWENRWFPIVNATLRVRFPELHAIICLARTRCLRITWSLTPSWSG